MTTPTGFIFFFSFYLFILNTVYQRIPDIAISEVGECCEGNHTRSVFVQFSLAFHDFSANVCVSDFADICDRLWDFGPNGGTWAKLGFLHNSTCSYALGILVNF